MRKTVLLVLLTALCISLHGQIQLTPEMLQQAKSLGISDTQIQQVQSTSADTSFGRQSGLRQTAPLERTQQAQRPDEEPRAVAAEPVFGSDIFGTARLSFEPNFNMPTPENYVLSAGDELLIELWGDSEASYTRTVSPDGVISLPSVGVIFLSGKTIEQAKGIIEDKLSAVYSEIKTGGIRLRVSLGQIRSIRVNIAGEAMAPGTYTLPSLSTLFNALYAAGGVNRIGSLRNIDVYRHSKRIASLDVYDYILNGKYDSNITLEDNDMIIVGPYRNHVRVSGKVKREQLFELKDGETVADLLRYAGGFTGEAYTRNVSVTRRATEDFRRVFTVEDRDFEGFSLRDGDEVSVRGGLDVFDNRVTVRGAVWRAGDYQLDSSTASVRALIEKAGGLREESYFDRAILRRKNQDDTYSVMSIGIPDILSGAQPDVLLKKDDDLFIPSKASLREPYYVTVRGEVNGIREEDEEDLLGRNILAVQSGETYVSPAERAARGFRLVYMDNMSVSDAILLAGGFRESASQALISVVRRKRDPLATVYDDVPAEMFQITLRNGLAFDQTGSAFRLQPFDEIVVRRSPGYVPQEFVVVNGEAVFTGIYNMTKNMRLSDLVEKAGGVTPYAYVKGAQLRRRFSPDDLSKLEAKARLLTAAADDRDSLNSEMLTEVPKYYLVGIDLEAAQKNRGGQNDVLLQEGDELVIPAYTSVVKISGAVIYPNAVTFEKGKSLKKYILNAGGYAQNARRKAYVVYANGQVETVRGGIFRRYPVIEPGCEIIVPIKIRRNTSLAEILGLATSTTSIAALINSMIK